jgi:CPA1 family monovalent cation:H+ antiporter
MLGATAATVPDPALVSLQGSAGDPIVTELIDLLTVFIIAGAVGVFVAKVVDVPYTIALLLAGVAASVVGVGVDIELSHDLILLVLLPPLLFEGAATTEFERLRRNAAPILTPRWPRPAGWPNS